MDDATVEVFEKPDIEAFGGTLNCNNPSIKLNVKVTGTVTSYSWTGPGGFTSSQPEPTVSVPGNYIVKVINEANCEAMASAMVFASPRMVSRLSLEHSCYWLHFPGQSNSNTIER